MNKVALTRILRDQGLRLSEAVEATGALLEGRSVSMPTAPATDLAALRLRLLQLGVAEVELHPEV